MSYPFASPYAQASPAPAQHAYHSYGRDDGTTPAHLRQDSHASEAEKYGAADDGTAARGRTHATYQDADDDRHAAPLYSKGIWQPDDKRAFARRNVGVKICRCVTETRTGLEQRQRLVRGVAARTQGSVCSQAGHQGADPRLRICQCLAQEGGPVSAVGHNFGHLRLCVRAMPAVKLGMRRMPRS